MKNSMVNRHIPPPYAKHTPYNRYYANWLKKFNWTHILTLRRHIPLSESACQKLADNLLNYSSKIKTIWMALEQDRGDTEMNHLHIILDSGDMNLERKEMVEALGIVKHPKTLSYFAKVNSSDAVSVYCTKKIGKGSRLRFHDFRYQGEKD